MKTLLLTIVLFLAPLSAWAGSTVLRFDGPITTTVIPSGELDPNDGVATFSGFYDEGDFRVRPNGGTWYLAGDLGDPVGHFFTRSNEAFGQFLAVSRISGLNILIGGEFVLKQLVVQPTDPTETVVLSVTGQNEDGNVLYQYLIPIAPSASPVVVRLDTFAPVGAFLTPVNRVMLGPMGAVGLRVFSLTVEPKAAAVIGGGGKRGR